MSQSPTLQIPEDKVLLDKKAVQALLRALTGPAHHIRELQATMNLPSLNIGEGEAYVNPIKQLVEEFNAQVKT